MSAESQPAAATADAQGLRLEGVAHRYARASRPSVAGVSLTLVSGVTALLDPNGAGKSSLIKLACGVLRPSGGRVLLDGRPATRRELAARVGWVPQQGATIPGFTVAEQIATPAG